MIDTNVIYDIALKTARDEALTPDEERIKKEIVETRESYVQYCACISITDMMEQRGGYATKCRPVEAGSQQGGEQGDSREQEKH
ncbi:MAG: hypothetical protein KHX84_01840 [Enterocloster asparagiformis]|nr:hypothetical protein [Enterocloster asparagiformis]